MTQHTPGPWAAWQAAGNYYATRWTIAAKNHSKPGVTSGLDCIAEVMGASDDESRANARLIAAAPDMLKALQEIIRSPSNVAVEKTDCRKAALAAIAKATGSE